MVHLPPRFLLLLSAAALALLLALLLHAVFLHHAAGLARGEALRIVERLELTDLCLFPGAPHTRHPSLADRHSAFHHHPMALDLEPAGLLLGPPSLLRTP